MATMAINLNQWSNALKQRLPSGVVAAFDGGSRRELLKQIDVAVLVFDDHVVNLQNGRLITLDLENGLTAEELAKACSHVMDEVSSEVSILLLLPPAEFVATTVSMPGLGKEALTSALQLQSDSLLPSFNQKLALAVRPSDSDSVHSDIALWISEDRLEELFQAFASHQMFLATVAPRPFALVSESGDLNLVESDRNSITTVMLENGVLKKWLYATKSDLQQEIFYKQFQQALEPNDELIKLESENAITEYRQTQAEKANKDYSFFPPGALLAKKQLEKGKRVIFATAAVAMLLFVCSLPFLAQTFEMRQLQRTLDSQRVLSENAREDRSVVQNFENEWGLINDFPEQDLREALFTLQSVLSPDQLSSLDLSEGIIQIEGESADPQAILQRLEQHPLFTEVAFSRATNNSNYFIDLRLSTVNFEGYMVRYFPDN